MYSQFLYIYIYTNYTFIYSVFSFYLSKQSQFWQKLSFSIFIPNFVNVLVLQIFFFKKNRDLV